MEHIKLFEQFEDFDPQDDIRDEEINEIATKEELLQFLRRHTKSPEEFAWAIIKTQELVSDKFPDIVNQEDKTFVNYVYRIMDSVPGGQLAIKGILDKIEAKIRKQLGNAEKPEPQQTEEEILKTMSKKQIMGLIDAALDAKDFTKVDKLRAYLESRKTPILKHLKLFEAILQIP